MHDGIEGVVDAVSGAMSSVANGMSGSSGGVYYGGHMYPDAGSASVAQQIAESGSAAFGSGSSSDANPETNPQEQVSYDSPVSGVDTGQDLGAVGGFRVGGTTSGGFPPTGAAITGNTNF